MCLVYQARLLKMEWDRTENQFEISGQIPRAPESDILDAKPGNEQAGR